jgi:hypothetical protein
VNRRVSISELTSVSATFIIMQAGKRQDGHEDQSTEVPPMSDEERYGDLIDCAVSDVFVGWWRLGLLPLAQVARTLR